MFYDRYVFFCSQKGISPSAAALEMGFQKSTISRWKKDGTDPTDANKHKVAAYFGISVEELMGETDGPKKSFGDFEGLSEKEKAWLQLFHALTEEQQDAILALGNRQ